MKFIRAIILFLLALALPIAAAAQQATAVPFVTSQGIFGCNQTGAYAMSAGSLTAVGGTFVPVSDTAVTLNTGYLAYKECTLRPAVDALVHSATADISQEIITKITTGNNGNPYFVQNFGSEETNAWSNGYIGSFSTVTGNLDPTIQGDIQRAAARSYSQALNAPYLSLHCSYNGNLSDAYNGTVTNILGTLGTLVTDPACNSYEALVMTQNQLSGYAAASQNAWQTQLQWGHGYYPIVDANGRVITPGYSVATVGNQALTSGFTQLQNANDIGQMSGALFASMGNQILSNIGGGLAGLTQSIGGQPSYTSQVAAEASQGLTQAVTNVALTILGPALGIEQAYNDAENAIAGNLTDTITQLRGSENTCWNLVIQKVCSNTPSYNASGGGSCSGTNGSTLRIATSTAFSQPVIDAQITPLAQAVATNVQNSNTALSTIHGLITGVQDTTSSAAQQSSLSQLDQLVGQGLLHNQNDLNTALQNQTDVSTAMQTLLTNTAHQWAGDSQNGDGSYNTGATAWDGASATGWCNVNQQQTLAKWQQLWGS